MIGLAPPSVKPSPSTAWLRVFVEMFDNPKSADNMLAGVAPQERRAYPRYAFSAAAEAVYVQADIFWQRAA